MSVPRAHRPVQTFHAQNRAARNLTTIRDAGVSDAEGVSAKIAKAFVDHPNWRQSEAALREVRKAVTFAVYAEKDDLDEVAAIVEKLLDQLLRVNL